MNEIYTQAENLDFYQNPKNDKLMDRLTRQWEAIAWQISHYEEWKNA